MIWWLTEEIFLDQSIKENIRKIATGQGNYFITGCLLHYPYFQENYRLIATSIWCVSKSNTTN